MDLHYYFSILIRRWKTIIAVVILVMMVSGITIIKMNKIENGALIFISIGSERIKDVDKENYNPREAVEAADRFTETIQGWMKNPDLIKRMEKSAETSVSLSARKQEKQNLVLDLKVEKTVDVKMTAEVVLRVLKSEIENYNRITNSTFKIAIESIDTREIYPNNKLSILVSFMLGLFLGILLVYGDEYLKGVVSFQSQAEEILGVKSFGILNKKDESSIGLMGSFLNTLGKTVVLAGVGFNTENISVAIARNMARVSDKNMALVDLDLRQRQLHKAVNVNMEENELMGVTDLSEKRYSFVSDYFQEIFEERIKFLPAGRGKGLSLEFFESMRRVIPKLVIHTTLPHNPEIFSLSEIDLILLIKLGKTKLQDLAMIKAVFKGRMKLVVVG